MISSARVDGPPFDSSKIALPADYAHNAARRYPSRTALIYLNQLTTYAQLAHSVEVFGGWLASRGVERIAYLGKNSDLFVIAILGCMRAGVILVPINWRLTAAEVAYVIADSKTELVIADEGFTAHIPTGIPVVTDLRDALAAAPAGLGPREVKPDDPCLLCYTSGTTGKPKAVALSQSAVAAAREMERQSPAYSDWSDEDIVLAAMPLFHIGGMSWALGALMRGLTCVITRDATPTTILDSCQQRGITRAFAVPTSIRAIIEEMTLRQITLPALRGVHYGAAPMDPALLTAAMSSFGCRFVQHFGMTETSGCATILGPADHNPAMPIRLRSLGLPLPGVSVAVRHPQTGAPCAVGAHGEIWIHGRMLMNGYAGNADASAEALADGWYRTGDGGYVDDSGYLFLTDRIKDMIISGGENVYPAEVETVLRRHPAVLDAAVFGVPDRVWGEMVVAVVELRSGKSAAAAELAQHLRESLAGFKIPRLFDLQGALPRTASGKIQRGRARQLYLQTRTVDA